MTGSWQWSGAAVLFDMDGTLVDSTGSVQRAWHWLADQLELPADTFDGHLHGIPASQVLDELVPWLEPDRRRQLSAELVERQCLDTSDVLAVPGALTALDQLASARWAIVTSASRPLALARIEAAGLPLPRTLVTTEQTAIGKPAPDPYLAAADLLGLDPADCLVVEDSTAGVSAGRAAGCQVLGVLTTSDQLAGVAVAVADLSQVRFSADRLGVYLEVVP